MNDEQLLTAIRDACGDVHSATPVEAIVTRSRALRARRNTAAAAALAAAAASVGIVVAVALPSSAKAPDSPAAAGPAPTPSVRLAAWTVTRQPDGSIAVSFRAAADAAGLQRTLRGDGVPVNVVFPGQASPACQLVHGPLADVVGGSAFRRELLGLSGDPTAAAPNPPSTPPSPSTSGTALVIHPAALPPGVGLQITASGTPGAAGNFGLFVNFVKRSPQCTGS